MSFLDNIEVINTHEYRAVHPKPFLIAEREEELVMKDPNYRQTRFRYQLRFQEEVWVNEEDKGVIPHLDDRFKERIKHYLYKDVKDLLLQLDVAVYTDGNIEAQDIIRKILVEVG